MSGFVGLPGWIAYPLGIGYVALRPWQWPKLWRQWRRSKRTCRTCDHADDNGTLCFESLGFGYGQPTDPDADCEKWSKRLR